MSVFFYEFKNYFVDSSICNSGVLFLCFKINNYILLAHKQLVANSSPKAVNTVLTIALSCSDIIIQFCLL